MAYEHVYMSIRSLEIFFRILLSTLLMVYGFLRLGTRVESVLKRKERWSEQCPMLMLMKSL